MPSWVPLAAGVATLCTTLVITRAVTRRKCEGAGRCRPSRAPPRRSWWQNSSRPSELVARIAAFSADQSVTSSSEWTASTLRVLQDNPGIRRLVWLDSAWNQVEAIGIDAAPVDSATLMRVLADESARGASADRAPVGIVEVGGHGPGTMLLAGAPACNDERCNGVLLSFVDATQLVRQALALYPAEYGVRVRGMARELYHNDNPTNEVAWFATDTVRVGGLRWTVSSWPMSSVQGLYRSDLREVIAVLGVIVSILVSLLLRLLYFTQAAARTVERERLQLALDSSTDGLWEQDLDTGESHRSEGVWRGLGYDPHTLTPRGATAVWDSLIHPEDRPRVQRAPEEPAGRTDTRTSRHGCRPGMVSGTGSSGAAAWWSGIPLGGLYGCWARLPTSLSASTPSRRWPRAKGASGPCSMAGPRSRCCWTWTVPASRRTVWRSTSPASR